MAEKSRVVRYQADRTNQKLYFCRLACQQASNCQDKQQYQAYRETAIFHLHGAYLAFLQELSSFYDLKQSQPTCQSIEQALTSKTLISPEILRLKQLLQSGILANVINAYQRCQYAPALETTQVAATATDLITNVVTLTNQWLPDEQIIREWRQELIALIDELRGGMLEY